MCCVAVKCLHAVGIIVNSAGKHLSNTQNAFFSYSYVTVYDYTYNLSSQKILIGHLPELTASLKKHLHSQQQ